MSVKKMMSDFVEQYGSVRVKIKSDSKKSEKRIEKS